MGLIEAVRHVHTMDDFLGAHEPQRPNVQKVCPDCFGLMSSGATLCVACSGARSSERQSRGRDEDTMDRHRRWSACLEAGFTNEEMMAMRPFVFEWKQIVQFAPDVVIRGWWDKTGQ